MLFSASVAALVAVMCCRYRSISSPSQPPESQFGLAILEATSEHCLEAVSCFGPPRALAELVRVMSELFDGCQCDGIHPVLYCDMAGAGKRGTAWPVPRAPSRRARHRCRHAG
jgi:hypothetical protein